ncbi:MAG: FISUMP domain-containing protein [Ignavibacteria bacterium]|nr:FISUMP domain-containing protein [Ignavibacteria bacterium]
MKKNLVIILLTILSFMANVYAQIRTDEEWVKNPATNIYSLEQDKKFEKSLLKEKQNKLIGKINLETIAQGLYSADELTKLNAADILSYVPGNAYILKLEDLLLNDPSAEVRYQCAKSLLILDSKSSIHVLILALNDINRNVKIQVALALAALGEKEKCAAVIDLLWNNGDADAPLYSCHLAFLDLATPDAFNKLIYDLNNTDKYIAIDAAIILAQLGYYKEAFPFLKSRLNDNDKYIRMAALRGLAYIGTNNAIELIKSKLNDDENMVRERASSILKNCNLSFLEFNNEATPKDITITYNPTAAASYADYWTNPESDLTRHNPAFHYYTNNDCSNFVSQCLIEGGLNLSSGPGLDPYGDGCIPACDNLHKNLTTYQGCTYSSSYTGHMTSSYPSWFVQGDVVLFGADASNPNDPWQHAAINVVTGTPALDAHTNNRYHRSVGYFYPSTGIGFKTGDFYHFTSTVVSLPGLFTLTLTPECNGTTSQIKLNWTASSNATSYDIYRDGSLYYSMTTLATQFINSTNIAVGTSYSYYVKAKNSAGSTNSNTQSATVPNCTPSQYSVNLSSNPSNGGTTSGGGTYNSGQSVTITATPYSGYSFVNWKEGTNIVSINANYTFTISDSRTLVAYFAVIPPTQYSINLSSNPSNGGTTSGGGIYNSGTQATVTAFPNNGWSFINWTENGSQVSTNTSYTFTVSYNRNLVANFQQNIIYYNVSTSSNPSNGGTTSGGGNYTSGQQITVSAASYSGYTFANWTENGNPITTNASYTFNVTGNRNLVANFTTCTYTLGTYSTSAISSATSGAFWVFTKADCNWTAITGGCNGMITLKNYTGNGDGMVTFDISANTNTSPRMCTIAVGGQTFTVNQAGYVAPCVNAPATPNSLSVSINNSNVLYLSWGGNSTNVSDFIIERGLSGSGPFEVIGSSGANFDYKDSNVIGGTTYYYRVKACCSSNCSNYTNVASGQACTFSTAPTGIIASEDTISQGESVTLTVQGGSLGTGAVWTWRTTQCNSGPLVGTGSSITVTPNTNTVYVVKPEGGNCITSMNCAVKLINIKQSQQTYKVTTGSNPANGGTASGGATYNTGSNVTVTATPNSGWSFTNWTENGTIVSTSSSYLFMIIGDRTLIANFHETQNIQPCPGTTTVTYQGKTYNTVQIGTQCWLRENLDVGTMIQGNQVATNNSVIEKYCYNNDANNCNTYGGLYQWAEAVQYKNGATNNTSPNPAFTGNIQGICPSGWHISTQTESNILVTAVSGDGNALKAIGQGTGSGAGTNTSGFSMLLAGTYYYYDGNFGALGVFTNFWSSTEYDNSYAIALYLYRDKSQIDVGYIDKGYGFSIRCLKDETSSVGSIIISSPNGGENWQVGTNKNITWTSSNVTNVKIEYTSNNGTSWATIISNTPATANSYSWLIPNTPSSQCKVKICDVGNSAVNDESDNLYQITSANSNPCSGISAITFSGKTYNTVVIGSQCWLKENLDVGTMILGNQSQSNNSLIEKYCYDNNPNNCNMYGGLYQWNEAMGYSSTPDIKGICPDGWHIPTWSEFQTLGTSVNHDGNALKAIGQGTGIGTGTNTSGFTGLLAGYRSNDGYYDLVGIQADFWSSTEYDAANARALELRYNSSFIDSPGAPKDLFGISVRCIKNESGTGVEGDDRKEFPIKYSVFQNYPNPFNPNTTIRYDLPKEGMVTIKIYDLLGREVKTLVDEYKSAGSYNVEFNASNLSSGTYIYRMVTENFTEIKKLILMK